MIADSAGTTVWRWDQGEPFGNDVPNNNPSGAGAFDFPLRFPGQYFDRETGLYNYHRNYSSDLARYIESDPIGIRGGVNIYVYVGSDPLTMTDPEGLFAYSILGGGPTPRPNGNSGGRGGNPQNSGCDWFPDFNSCATECCNKHDEC